MTVTRQEISADEAQELVTAAADHARDKGWRVAIAVADPHGALVAALRMDGTIVPAMDFAMDKAMTAASLRSRTSDFGARMASSPTLSLGVGTRNGFITWAGGIPVFDGGECIGGIGVSGAKDAEDVACAEAAISQAGFATEA